MRNVIIFVVKDNTKKTLSIYARAAAHYPFSMVISILAVVALSVIGSIIPLYFKDFFNLLSQPGERGILVQGLLKILMMIAALDLVHWLLWRINNIFISRLETRALGDLANKCFANLHRHSFSYFNNNFVGSLVKRVNWFTRGFEGVVDKIIWNIIPLVVNIVMIIVILATRSLYLSLAILIWTIIFLIVNYTFTKYKLQYDIKRNEAESETTAVLADTITNNANVKLFNGYWREVKNFAETVGKLTALRKFTWNLGTIFDALQGFLTIVLEIGIFFVAIKLWQQGVLTVGDFVLIQVYIFNLFNEIWNFGRVIRQLYEHLADAEEMTIILSTPHEIVDMPGAKELKVKKGEIKFNKVVFKYGQGRTILNKLDLIVKPGENIAFIGPSGAGKTTLVKLIFRMHDLTSGKITIDNQDIAKVTQESLWKNISLVPQDPILFHRTLMENIRYGQPKATDEEVIEAAKKARCHDFIVKQEHGYSTYVGERGIKLSGGERQRVAIARAILRNAPILVLDEATSSLDSESEHLIQEALNELMKNKTVLVIAHRLSTIRHADRIVVIDKGQVIEEGTHDELASQTGGIYAKLWQLQAEGFIK